MKAATPEEQHKQKIHFGGCLAATKISWSCAIGCASAVMEINDIEEKARTRTIFILVLANIDLKGLFQWPQRSAEETETMPAERVRLERKSADRKKRVSERYIVHLLAMKYFRHLFSDLYTT